MAKREWGLLCPEGHGLLVQREQWHQRGVAWCPHEDHGGNGRFWRLNEAEEGWFDPTRPIEPTPAQLERVAHAQARSAEWQAYLDSKKVKERRMAADKAATKAETKKVAKPPQDCGCGCGGQTKGGRFIPGHDARFHSRIRALEAQGVGHDEAAKIASKGPLTGKYAPKPAAAKAKADKAPTPIKSAKSARAKAPDLTKRASDEPAPDGETEGTAVEVEQPTAPAAGFEV